MKVETDGTINPQEAIHNSTKILLDHFSLIAPEETEKSTKKKKTKVKVKKTKKEDKKKKTKAKKTTNKKK